MGLLWHTVLAYFACTEFRGDRVLSSAIPQPDEQSDQKIVAIFVGKLGLANGCIDGQERRT